jgi:hypothetical protein
MYVKRRQKKCGNRRVGLPAFHIHHVLSLAVVFEFGLWEKVSAVFARGGSFRVDRHRDGATGRLHIAVLGNHFFSDKGFIRVAGQMGHAAAALWLDPERSRKEDGL